MRAATSLSGHPEWGVKCLDPEVEIWGVHFPTRMIGELAFTAMVNGGWLNMT